MVTQLSKRNADNFAEWMMKIQSIHYANTSAMARAIESFKKPKKKRK